MAQLVLLRHGQSLWNRDNRFTGWVDVDLSEQGLAESEQAAALLLKNGLSFDVCYTSYLRRAIKTLWIVLEKVDLMWLAVHTSWRLNERHYGALQGLNKEQMAEREGPEQVHLWRRSYAVRPPALTLDDPRWPGRDPRYAGLPAAAIPRTESLKDTLERVLPYWNEVIVPELQRGGRVLIVAHGNSLRGLIKTLESLSDDAIPAVEIPTGKPLVYRLDDTLAVQDKYYLE